jgi:hypothetical protein
MYQSTAGSGPLRTTVSIVRLNASTVMLIGVFQWRR